MESQSISGDQARDPSAATRSRAAAEAADLKLYLGRLYEVSGIDLAVGAVRQRRGDHSCSGPRRPREFRRRYLDYSRTAKVGFAPVAVRPERG